MELNACIVQNVQRRRSMDDAEGSSEKLLNEGGQTAVALHQAS